ncbi:LytTR family transcriptional regulator DNA-binding domain-containing protein [Chakrabartyella piscis]|uniref:LytTR family transcriptional regulator DNA-binding domain-containing protein n=1 Tax=Chakrabartyella piscis TaxID=2918914 RepID=UPI002958C714|nr:LytTR family transcriptional regulator DNA-binding domain-containing protein [Chakrabartyella piscis]
MSRKNEDQRNIIQLSQDVLHGFYGRNINHLIHLLADDFLWIGAFDFQYTTTKEQFLNIIQSELRAEPFTMLEESFSVVSSNSYTTVVCGTCKLIAHTEKDKIMQTHTRFTLVWKHRGTLTQLVHIHGSNAQDIPLSVDIAPVEISPDFNFFQYLMAVDATSTDSKKIVFRDISGIYHYFFADEILYIEASLKNAILYTKEGSLKISGLLSAQEDKLPPQFYRIHKSYLVNTLYVKSIQRYKVVLQNDMELPVSKQKYVHAREILCCK